MAHPIRPASYAEINNFYTATVYQKGAQVIRMIETLIGRANFRRGMDLYFERHDGQAVTCEDFVQAMQDASGVDLTQFRRWYSRAGTPRLKASGHYDAAAKRYTLTLTQSLAPTAYEKRLAEAGIVAEEGPLHIPVAIGLVQPDGSDAIPTTVLSLTEATQTFHFDNIAAAPVASLLRDYSAPVHLDFEQGDDELAHLMAHDSDPFNRWEAGQRLATRALLAGVAAGGNDVDWIPPALVTACARILADAKAARIDPGFAAEALVLPPEQVLAEEVAALGKTIDPDAIHRARQQLRRHLATSLFAAFDTLWQALAPTGPYAPEGEQIGRRALRNACLAYLAEADEQAALPRLTAQFEQGGNMTDVGAALGILANLELPQRQTALDAFYAKWQNEALVVDKWLNVQATSRLDGTTARVRTLMRHPAFDLKNPNKVYALVRAFCAANPRHFHAADGSGYALAADVIVELQASNPQVASRIARAFDRWRQFDAGRQAHACAALERIRDQPGLARDVAEVVGNALR
jgi:aminopeptidase N